MNSSNLTSFDQTKYLRQTSNGGDNEENTIEIIFANIVFYQQGR